ncbi:MAG: ROK family protein [Candidatus Paceibacterota bacterium]
MYIIFDIGGTKMRIASSKDLVTFSEPVFVDTPLNFKDGVDTFLKKVEELTPLEEIKGVAGGIAGTIDKNTGKLFWSPHLTGWVGGNLSQEISEKIKAPVFIENDSAIVGLGEAVAGAGKDKEIVVYITISTGVGGARIVNGFLDEKRTGFEPGHQVIDFEKMMTLEDYISGSALKKKYGMTPTEIKDDKLWNDFAKILAVGIHNSVVHWSPDVIILGGPMIIGNPSIPFEKVVENFNSNMKIFSVLPEVKKAELGHIGGLHGALTYLRQKLEAMKK